MDVYFSSKDNTILIYKAMSNGNWPVVNKVTFLLNLSKYLFHDTSRLPTAQNALSSKWHDAVHHMLANSNGYVHFHFNVQFHCKGYYIETDYTQFEQITRIMVIVLNDYIWYTTSSSLHIYLIWTEGPSSPTRLNVSESTVNRLNLFDINFSRFYKALLHTIARSGCQGNQ